MKKKVGRSTYAGYYSKKAKYQPWIEEAGAIFVICTNVKRTVSVYGEDGNLWALLDTAAAVQNMLLTATSMSLASCWVGGINKKSISKLLGIPPNIMPISLVVLGYPDKKEKPKEKLDPKWVTHKKI